MIFFWFLFAVIVLCAWGGLGLNSFLFRKRVWGLGVCIMCMDSGCTLYVGCDIVE